MTGRSYHSIPGAFPPPNSPPQLQTGSASNSNTTGFVNPVTSSLIDKANLHSFEGKHVLIQKAKHQQDIVTQLEALVYILVGYQFIKYCHSACLVPVVFHIAYQKMLSCDPITSNNTTEYRMGIAGLLLVTRGEENPTIRDRATRIVLTKSCLMLYWKTIITSLYHILFITTWMMYIVNDGSAYKLEHGTWWFISFIGEEAPLDIDASTNYWVKLAKLGLPGLLITDMIILFIQLVLYQCVYKQSTLLPHRGMLVDKEVYLLRTVSETATTNARLDDSIDPHETIPLVLKVKLFESFSWEAFIT
ncbi:uncharacterized protein RJT20DRAFT_24506 [Scheffersomyces xylosifermentans]|uniref:uncharacterized protein n=1 Tax=Scheffersomyces xylosifermentans TaxID=1304137 RepID=UPI00315D6E6D